MSIAGQLVSGFVSVILFVMLARIYVQLAQPTHADVGVPSARTDQRDLRCAVDWQNSEKPGIGEALDRALEGREAGAPVGGQRRRMVERAGVDVDAVHAARATRGAPLQRAASGHGPCPEAPATRPTKASSHSPASRKSSSSMPASRPARRRPRTARPPGRWMIGAKLRIVHDQTREPQPRRADQRNSSRYASARGDFDPAAATSARRGNLDSRRLAHLEEGDDGRKFAVRDRLVAHFHFASGGRLIRIASILPPVLRPNNVPRS